MQGTNSLCMSRISARVNRNSKRVNECKNAIGMEPKDNSFFAPLLRSS